MHSDRSSIKIMKTNKHAMVNSRAIDMPNITLISILFNILINRVDMFQNVRNSILWHAKESLNNEIQMLFWENISLLISMRIH